MDEDAYQIKEHEWKTHENLRKLKEAGIPELVAKLRDDLTQDGMTVLKYDLGQVIPKNDELGFCVQMPGIKFSVSIKSSKTTKLHVIEYDEGARRKLQINLEKHYGRVPYWKILEYSKRVVKDEAVGKLREYHRLLDDRLRATKAHMKLRSGEPRGKKKARNAGGGPRQPNKFRRLEVENAAMNITKVDFERQGYIVTDRSAANLGWDFEAIRGSQKLRLEVKGLSGASLAVELTHNEYEKMQSSEYRDSYRLCVVTNALTATPHLATFRHDGNSGYWKDAQNRTLRIKELVAARCVVE